MTVNLCAYGHFICVKKVPALIFLRETKRIVHEDFSACPQNTKIILSQPEQKWLKATQNYGLVSFL